MNLDDRLRTIDPARYIESELGTGERARATFSRIITSEASTAPVERPLRRRRTKYVVTATAASGALLFVATARPATPAERQSLGEACIDLHSDPGARPENHHFTVAPAEVRGDYAYVVLGGADGFEATCLTRPEPAPVLGYGFMAPLTGQPSPRGIVTNRVRSGQLEANSSQYEVTGKVGTDVVAVTVEAPGVDVHATVQNGRFAAWWPGATNTSLFTRLTGGGGPPNPDVTLTYRDGTTHRAPIQTYDVSPM